MNHLFVCDVVDKSLSLPRLAEIIVRIVLLRYMLMGISHEIERVNVMVS